MSGLKLKNIEELKLQTSKFLKKVKECSESSDSNYSDDEYIRRPPHFTMKRSPSGLYRSSDRYRVKQIERKSNDKNNESYYSIKVEDSEPNTQKYVDLSKMTDGEFNSYIQKWDKCYTESPRVEFVERLLYAIERTMRAYANGEISEQLGEDNKNIILFIDDLVLCLSEYFGSGDISNKIVFRIKPIPITSPFFKTKDKIEDIKNKPTLELIKGIQIGKCDLNQLQSGAIKNILCDTYHISLDTCYVTKEFADKCNIK